MANNKFRQTSAFKKMKARLAELKFILRNLDKSNTDAITDVTQQIAALKKQMKLKV